MTVQDALRKIKVMLAVEETEVKEEIKMSDAVLVDGTEVYTEGDLAVGAVLYVKVEEGEAPFAPEGIHETVDGQMISVGPNGEITEISEKVEEAPAEEVVEETMEEVEVEVPVAEAAIPATEELLNGIAEIIAPFTEEIATLTEEVTALKARFNKIAGEPAASPIRNTFSETKLAKENLVAQRMEALRAIRKN